MAGLLYARYVLLAALMALAAALLWTGRHAGPPPVRSTRP